MKISKLGLDKVQPANGVRKSSTKNTTNLGDVSLKISDLTKKIAGLSNNPSANCTLKVEEIKAKVDAGEYKIDAEKIARILLGLKVNEK